jgi:hypothetical protein
MRLFVHVGLHKTGTSFLQQNVFPKWRGLTYVPWDGLEHFLRLEEGKTYLLSREGLSGRFWARHAERDLALQRLSAILPHARILVSFRRHDAYIVSMYKQYLQIGGALPFEGFFDLEGDRGLLRRDDFLFRRKVESIEKHFGHTPFVFLHEEIVRDLGGLLRDMERLFEARAPALEDIRISYPNRSVGYYPARLLIRLNRLNRSEMNPAGRVRLDNRVTRMLRIDPRRLCQHWLSFLPDRPMLGEERAREIREFFESDWEYVTACAKTRLS